jgi:hypothetical protein
MEVRQTMQRVGVEAVFEVSEPMETQQRLVVVVMAI